MFPVILCKFLLICVNFRRFSLYFGLKSTPSVSFADSSLEEGALYQVIFRLSNKLRCARRGAHRAPVIGICAKFRICSFTVKKFIYSFICRKGYSPPSRGRIAFCLQSKESPAFPPGIPYTHLGFLITWQTPGRWPCRSPGSQPSRRRRYPRQRSGWR